MKRYCLSLVFPVWASCTLTLQGQAGDDILVAGAEGGVLTGGAGNDLFVLAPTDGVLQITDFQTGADRLDLSGFPMLRSIEQLVVTTTATGAMIGFGKTRIDIRSFDGQPLTAREQEKEEQKLDGSNHHPQTHIA